MKPKTIITVALVIFLCAAVAYLVQDEVRAKSAAREEKTGQSVASGSIALSSTEQSPTPAVSGEPTVSADKTTQIEPAQTGSDKTGSPTRSRPGAITNMPRQTPTESGQEAELRIDSARSKRTAESPGSLPLGSQPVTSPSVSPQSVDSKSAGSQNPQATSAQKVLAYYFHGTQRCPTCRKLEAYSTEAIEKGFGAALKQGNLEWRVVNVDELLNRHFVNDYQLYTKSLVIVKMQGGKQVEWKNLERIWELVGEKDDFIKYVQDEVSAYLGERR